MKSRRRSLSMKKVSVRSLADEIRSESTTVSINVQNPTAPSQDFSTEKKPSSLRKRSSISDLNAIIEPVQQETKFSLKDSALMSNSKSSLRLHIERRKSKFNGENHNSPIQATDTPKECSPSPIKLRPPTPSAIICGDDKLSSNLPQKMHSVCAAGRVEQLTALLDYAQNIDHFLDLNNQYLDDECNRCTLMHTAAKYQRIPIMHLLWLRGSSVDTMDTLESTPLFHAAASGCLRACAFLLSKNAQINLRDRFDNTPLSIALRSNYYDIARLMLFFKADIHFKVSTKGQTLLHVACEEGSESKISFLLENGASVFRTNRDDETPLFLALSHSNIVKLLCQHTLDLGSNNLVKLLRMVNAEGETVFHVAVRNNCISSLLALIESIPLPLHSRQLQEMLNDNEKTHHSNTPLHIAVIGNHMTMVKFLVMCQEIDMTRQNANGDTALHLAIKERKGEMVYILKQFDYDKKSRSIRNSRKLTPKQLAKDIKAMDSYYFNGNRRRSVSVSMMATNRSNHETIHTPRPSTRSHDVTHKVRRFISQLNLTPRKSSPNASLSSMREEEEEEEEENVINDLRTPIISEGSSNRQSVQQQQQEEFVKQLRMTLKSDSMKPLRSVDKIPVKQSSPLPPSSITIEQVVERLDELLQLMNYESDFNYSSAGRIALMDAASSFVRVTRLYVNSIEKKIMMNTSMERQRYLESYKNFLSTIQAVCLDDDGLGLDVNNIREWRRFLINNAALPILLKLPLRLDK